jgi:predicted MFS family arabinose efflux permease
MQTLLAACVTGVGTAGSAIVGGLVYERYGARILFASSGWFALIGVSITVIMYFQTPRSLSDKFRPAIPL